MLYFSLAFRWSPNKTKWYFNCSLCLNFSENIFVLRFFFSSLLQCFIFWLFFSLYLSPSCCHTSVLHFSPLFYHFRRMIKLKLPLISHLPLRLRSVQSHSTRKKNFLEIFIHLSSMFVVCASIKSNRILKNPFLPLFKQEFSFLSNFSCSHAGLDTGVWMAQSLVGFVHHVRASAMQMCVMTSQERAW